MDFLERIVDSTRAAVAERRRARSEEELRAALAHPAPGRERHESGRRPFSEALVGDGIALIAEIKRARPCRGELRADLDVAATAAAYERSGAAALSVLTEGEHFRGSLADISAAREATTLPVLRKDFVIDRYQLLESRVAGAAAVLLIVAAIPDEGLLHAFMDEAAELELDTLVEVHDAEELDRAIDAGADVIGINNRDLRTFEVDLELTFTLLEDVPAGTIVVAESGVSDPDVVADLQTAGVDAVLVGEALMRAADPGAEVARLLGHR